MEIEDLDEISRLFKLLGHPKRLQLLRKYGLVKQIRHGKTIIYHLQDPKVMTLIADVVSHAEKIVKSS